MKDQFDKLRKERFKNIPLFIVSPHNTKFELQKLPLIEGTLKDAQEMANRSINPMFK